MKYVFAIIMIFLAIIVGVMLFSFLINAAPPVLDATSRGSAQLGKDLGQAVNPDYYVNRPAVSGPTTAQAAPAPTTSPAPGSGTQKVVPTTAAAPAAPAAAGAPAKAAAAAPSKSSTGTGRALSTARYLEILKTAEAKHPDSLNDRISAAIDMLNDEFNKDQSKGYRGKAGTVIDNPGPGGVAIVWTDTGNASTNIPEVVNSNAGDISANWIPVDGFAARANDGQSTTNGWGLWRVHTAVKMKTTFTAIRLDSPLP